LAAGLGGGQRIRHHDSKIQLHRILRPGANVIKLFTAVSYDFSY